MNLPISPILDDDSATLLLEMARACELPPDRVPGAPTPVTSIGIIIRNEVRSRAARRCVTGRPLPGDRETFIRWRREVSAGATRWGDVHMVALTEAAKAVPS